mmetsp:Transcript_30207/g.85182  ORF Transcript_30207/g.85182 Transcript_30207/m.85182 type:complete len:316 (-) Transcript_30207:804-1751(-)
MGPLRKLAARRISDCGGRAASLRCRTRTHGSRGAMSSKKMVVSTRATAARARTRTTTADHPWRLAARGHRAGGRLTRTASRRRSSATARLVCRRRSSHPGALFRGGSPRGRGSCGRPAPGLPFRRPRPGAWARPARAGTHRSRRGARRCPRRARSRRPRARHWRLNMGHRRPPVPDARRATRWCSSGAPCGPWRPRRTASGTAIRGCATAGPGTRRPWAASTARSACTTSASSATTWRWMRPRAPSPRPPWRAGGQSCTTQTPRRPPRTCTRSRRGRGLRAAARRPTGRRRGRRWQRPRDHKSAANRGAASRWRR